MTATLTKDPETLSDEEEVICCEETFPPEKTQSVREILFLAFSSLGAVYGDIGTSPLYVLDSIKYPHSEPTKEDIYGAVSIIFYLFILLVLLKYALIVLTFGPNEGEGGQVAIYAKISRFMNFGPKGVIIPGAPQKSDLELLKRAETTNSIKTDKSHNPAIAKVISVVSLVGCFLGCSLVMSDGLLTPTTSVLSAVAGIQVAEPSFSHVLVVSEAILIFLFFIQQFGSQKITYVFAPIIFVWFLGLVICGCINISHHPAIFKSLSPYYAIQLLKGSGIDALGGAMLAITGTEAMFADLGHFGKVPTQIGILGVLICLTITYLGQGAYLVNHPENISNVFYESIPGGVNSWAYWIMFVLAILSTIIASQALILSVFSILSQMINLDCFPKFKIVHVSASYVGKVYIPMANLFLFIGVCATTAGFKTSNNVTAAYGLGISLDFVVTSVLMMICFVYVYKFNWWVALIYCLIFVPLEVCLVIANLKKVPHGGWFPLMMAAVFLLIFSCWRYCRGKTVEKQLASRVRIIELFPQWREKPVNTVVNLGPRDVAIDSQYSKSGDDLSSGKFPERVTQEISEEDKLRSIRVVATKHGQTPVNFTPGIAVIYSDTPHSDLLSPNSVPAVYAKIVRNFALLPSVVVFCTIRVLSIPTVAPEDRILVGATKLPGHYNCILRFGFMEEVVADENLSQEILNQFSEMHELKREQGKVLVLHVFETNRIRSTTYYESPATMRNPLLFVQRYLRAFMINHVFSPVNAVFQNDDRYVKITNEDDEREKKIFVGGTMRI